MKARKFGVVVILALMLTPLCYASLEWNGNVTYAGSGAGNIRFNGNATAAEVTIDGEMVEFSNLGFGGVYYTGLNLGASAGANITVTQLQVGQFSFNSSAATGAEAEKAQSGTRSVASVTGASSYSGSPLVTIIPSIGTALITVFFIPTGGGGTAGTPWLIILIPLILFATLVISRRSR